MQAVADALGVDRKALHRYVGDRDGLLELVVADLFESELKGVDLPADGDWPEVLHAYGKALRRGVIELGVIWTHVRLSGTGGSKMLALAERVLNALLAAGFSVDEAGTILTFIASVAISAARDTMLMAQTRVHHHLPEVARALQTPEAGEFPLLSQVVAARGIEAPVERDFEFELRVIIAGLESLLSSRKHSAVPEDTGLARSDFDGRVVAVKGERQGTPR